jgi:hypothetical protein
MSFSASAFALVGGPFDNGDYSELMDQNGVYQWTASMPDGMGEGQFNDSVSVGATVTSSSSSTASTTNNAIGSVQDRSIFYYKGVTFFGQCFGIVDLSQKTISCITNGSSQVTIANTGSSSSSTTTTGASTSGISASSTVLNNGNLGFVANSTWNGNITETNPTLVFHGTGQFTVISPNAQNIVSGLAQTIVSGNSSTSSSGGTGLTLITISPANAIASALAVLSTPAFQTAITPENLDEVQQQSDQVGIDVTGTRKYFLGQ